MHLHIYRADRTVCLRVMGPGTPAKQSTCTPKRILNRQGYRQENGTQPTREALNKTEKGVQGALGGTTILSTPIYRSSRAPDSQLFTGTPQPCETHPPAPASPAPLPRSPSRSHPKCRVSAVHVRAPLCPRCLTPCAIRHLLRSGGHSV